MTVPVQKFREVVFQLLYSFDIGSTTEEEMIPLLMKEISITKKTVMEAQKRVNQITERLTEMDQMIAKTSQSYAFERIPYVERNILRLGIFELFYDQDIPPKVAIAEAVRLARKFATPESATFINAILDALYKSSIGHEIDSSQLHQSLEDLTKSEEIARKIIEDSSKHEKTNRNEG